MTTTSSSHVNIVNRQSFACSSLLFVFNLLSLKNHELLNFQNIDLSVIIYVHKFIGIPISMGNRPIGLMEYHFSKITVKNNKQNICKKERE